MKISKPMKSLLPMSVVEFAKQMQYFTPMKMRHPIPVSRSIHIRCHNYYSNHHHHPICVIPQKPLISHLLALNCSNPRRYTSKDKPSSLLVTSFAPSHIRSTRNCGVAQHQQWRFWNESARNPLYVAMEEEERKKAEAEKNDIVGRRLREIEATPGGTQSIWASVFLDGKLVNGTQITIPKYNANIDMIKYAVKKTCPEIFTDIAAINFQVLPTRHKRKKSRRKLTRKNRILKADVIYDMALHGGESEEAGIIVKAHTRKMQDGNHYTYGEKTAIDFGNDYIRAIMHDYEDIPGKDGIKVLYDVPDLECGTSKNVVLRDGISESFWNHVIELLEPPYQPSSEKTFGDDVATEQQQTTVLSSEWSDNNNDSDEEQEDHVEVLPVGHRHRVCVVGSNGVGKTTSTAVLIRSLLQSGKSVVYHIRTINKSRWVYEFIPNVYDSENPYNVDVKVIPESKFNPALTPTLVDNINNYYIVDHGTTVDENCNPDNQLQCRVVLITSPDERQWGGNNFTILRGGTTSGTFVYYPSWELPDLLTACSLMIPRTLPVLTHDMVRERFHEVGGLPGHVLATPHSYRNIVAEQLHHVLSLTDKQLQLIARNYWRHMGHCNTIVGYMRHRAGNDSYDDTIASPASTKVFEMICVTHKTLLWNELQRNVVDVPFANRVLGVWFRRLMEGESVKSFVHRDVMNDSVETEFAIVLGGCYSSEYCDTDIIQAATKAENVLFYCHPLSANVIDCVYRKGNVYYLFFCTVELRCQVQLHCLADDIQKASNSVDSQIRYNCVVPSYNFEHFTVITDTDQNTDDTRIHNKIGVISFRQ